MLKKKWILVTIVVAIILVIGGKIYMDKKNTFKISEEQQKNVAIKLVRSYKNIQDIEFIKSYKDVKTGFYGVTFKINNDDSLTTGLSVKDPSQFDISTGIVGLSPVNLFDRLNPTNNDKNFEIDLSDINIHYLKE